MQLPKFTPPKLRIDFAMLAAAIVEVPRWAVAFTAIHEPVYAAVPMGLLLAWAASEGWKTYFDNRRRILLLCINIASLVGALIVIGPVLYAMTSTPLDAIDLSQVLPPQWLALWAAVLAITTFVPLVQVAAVKAYKTPKNDPAVSIVTASHSEQEPTKDADTATLAEHASQAPVVGTTQPTTRTRKRTVRKTKHTSAAQRRAQIISAGLDSAAEVVAQFGVGLRTAQADLSAIKNANRTNGVH